ncbi:LVIVD repeat-containing protein [Actinomadura rugatobispora]|uniref:LVIVD repeat-containing protein n=1 Tax=Actinomadura rugatobispora TaxID=1994 RepID=A0ABW1ABN1_9ACTN|nr:hypothetical protein GCM10010200_020290 [Actinomadura rugatobispora]
MADQNRISRRRALQASAATLGGLAAAASQQGTAQAAAPPARQAGRPVGTKLPDGSYAHNVEVVGYSDLREHPGFKMAVREVNGRWYLYVAHFNIAPDYLGGWSVVDVTDPREPELVNHIPGPVHTMTLQMDLSGDTMVTALEKPFPVHLDPTPDDPFEEGVVIWDIKDPVNPRRLSHWRTKGTGTHRNHYSGGRYVHLAAGMPGYRGNIYVILDISDRSRPKEAGRWWVPGQKEGETPAHGGTSSGHFHGFCCGAGNTVSLHGPAYVSGNLAYLPYGGAGMVVLDISDVSDPKPVSTLPFSPPFHSLFGVHGVLPLPEQGIAFVNSEDVSYGKGAAHHASIVDISNPSKPFLLSLLPEPVPHPDAPYEDFYTRGGWGGPHNMNHHQYHPAVERQEGIFYMAHFNAGLRIYDVSNRRLPQEIGHFLPADPKKRYMPLPEDKLVTQTEDVVVDRRGFIYISDKNRGIYVLRYTGPRPRLSR